MKIYNADKSKWLHIIEYTSIKTGAPRMIEICRSDSRKVLKFNEDKSHALYGVINKYFEETM